MMRPLLLMLTYLEHAGGGSVRTIGPHGSTIHGGVPRHQPDAVRGGQQVWSGRGSIDGIGRRSLQHAELTAEDEHLQVFGSVSATSQSSDDEETDERAGDRIDGEHWPIVPGLSERESGFPTPTGGHGVGSADSAPVAASTSVSLPSID
jgi:hypothetical protein